MTMFHTYRILQIGDAFHLIGEYGLLGLRRTIAAYPTLEDAREIYTAVTGNRDGLHGPLNFDRLLARQSAIALVWSVRDVMHECPHLNSLQAWEVLQECKDRHDADLGFTWELIRCVADDLYPKPRRTTRKGGRP